MDTETIRAELSTLASDRALLDEMNVNARSEAIDYLTFVEDLALSRKRIEDLSDLGEVAVSLRQRLEAANAGLFSRVSALLRSQERSPASARKLLERFTSYRPGAPASAYLDYDGLDVVLDGVLGLDDVTASPAAARDREMVHLEPTPARAVLDMVDHAGIVASDVFYDLGSGMGQVVVLVHLVTGALSCGVEVEPDYCRIAAEGAALLGLRDVRFINADARAADLSQGTVFFMFTPFLGGMLRRVLGRLQAVARDHAIRVCSYGSITFDLAGEGWLRIKELERLGAHRLAVFESTRAGP